MNIFDDYTRQVVLALNKATVKYLVVGGISGVEFNEAWNVKTDAVIDDVPIPLIHLNHLIVSKISAGRLKDKLDIETLQKIQHKKP